MAAPTSKGQGHGLAQVLNTGNAVNAYVGEQQRKNAEADYERKKMDATIDELKGRFDEVLKTDIFYNRDREAFMDKYNNLRNQFNGKWEQVYRGNTPEARQYNDALLELYTLAGKSKEDKQYAKEMYDDLTNPEKEDWYSDEDRARFEQFMTNPLSDRPTIIGQKPVDMEAMFVKGVMNPLSEIASNKAQQGGYDREGKRITYRTEALTEEERQKQLATFWSQNPAFQRQFYKTYQKQIEQDGIDPYELYSELYYDRTKIDKNEYSAFDTGSGNNKVEFNEGNIKEDVPYTKSATNVYGGTTYQTDGVTSNSPTSLGTIDPLTGKQVEWASSEKAVYSAPTLVYLDERGNILPMGKKSNRPAIYVFGTVGEGGGRKQFVRPFEEVEQDFKNSGYDTESIKSSLLQRGGGTQAQSIPVATRAEWKQAGWSDAQIDQAVKQGKIKLK